MSAFYRKLAVGIVAVLAIAVAFLLDPIAQDPAYHEFADERALFGVPNFWNVVTTLPFLRALLRSPQVSAGSYDTEWVEREFLEGFAQLMSAPAPDLALAAAAIAEATQAAAGPALTKTARGVASTPDPFAALGGWRQPGLGS